MERLSLSAKALHVGLSPEQDELENASKLCKFLDEALAEIPFHVSKRLEQVRYGAVVVRRHESFSDLSRN